MLATLLYFYLSYIWQVEPNKELFAYFSALEVYIFGICALTSWLESKL